MISPCQDLSRSVYYQISSVTFIPVTPPSLPKVRFSAMPNKVYLETTVVVKRNADTINDFNAMDISGGGVALFYLFIIININIILLFFCFLFLFL